MEKQTGELDLEFFLNSGFEKKQCIKCGSYFWTQDKERNTCGDTPCDEYTFIGNSPVPKSYSLSEMRDAFIKFFEKRGHKFLKPYPVVPRWREDVLLVNASIYDFQPHVTSGIVRPPGNPIVMSQPSIRMNDVDLVGITGRHLTSFEMLCHDSFNTKDKTVYWKEETVHYCYDFLTEGLGIDGKLISFKEKPWSGGGNAGNALEVFVRGLEVATLVFMDMKEDPNGPYEIDGIRYSKMDMRIVDTGYGLERLTWLSQGTPTVYQAIYPDIIQHVMKNSSVSDIDEEFLSEVVKASVMKEPYEESFVISQLEKRYPDARQRFEEIKKVRDVFLMIDHARSLMHMFAAYVIPSNVKVGYLARMLIRRAYRAISNTGYRGSLMDLIRMNHEDLKDIVPDFPEQFVSDVLSIEEEKYRDVERHGTQIIDKMISNKGKLSLDDLVLLYDSHGISPETVKAYLETKGMEIDVPDNFHAIVIKRHEKGETEKKKYSDYPEIETRTLYYDDPFMREFTGLVLFSKGNEIILDKTAFYPEGGGQPWDLGYFEYKGKRINVVAVRKYGKTIVHTLDGEIPQGVRVHGVIDWERRSRLMVHHTSTHLLLGVLREVLGEHVWQNGVQKDVEESRLDITHYRKIDEETIRKIEERVFDLIREGREVSVRNLDWYSAIDKYGFRLFEGGVPLTPKIRVVEIQGVDAEGCGGTHLKNISSIGVLKIRKVEAIQENIYRITFSAGVPALHLFQESYEASYGISTLLKKPIEEIAQSVSELSKGYADLRRSLAEARRRDIENRIANAKKIGTPGAEYPIIEADDADIGEISRIAHSRKVDLIVETRIAGKFKYTAISPSKKARDMIRKLFNADPEGNDSMASYINEYSE
ncbi:alanyl-tRNA synthetase related protein [Thermoplasma acidophilum]|uniref:Alanine--tRNA ligase n=1 Tax=Thermoplasma acidophilum (strain ATCC 25905 / DSM 1728 / JCM 9062 / NBRC 15155 / AMRC-C165) TaxID=273075 RepID=SYA_THEAC|nr:alanine--tRNA ligase [Thermoplasma acidophilum]Q9HJW4.1 RecName: Full=Alanine--tRNA ligase; AltName: Full=Alanyl-tRNA synthetase; Short=AlaRS [Thermoplasma acidophilum DSM 1728]MCY0851145.1 alanine--tRNA ligase [Thermoplasma acidophilum]CAC11978.1 alanyl-tRNA synthetase related protein [Thermoplasma acidophilum]